MFAILILLFTLVPAVEIYLIFTVGTKIGAFNTVMIIITTGILGAALAKSQGLQIIHEIQNKMNQGQLPGDQIIQGLMVFAGGLLLLTPGFMTDIFGFLLVLPGPRHIMMVFIKKAIGKSIHFKNQHGNQFYFFQSRAYTKSSGNEDTIEDVANSNSTDVYEAEFTKKDI